MIEQKELTLREQKFNFFMSNIFMPVVGRLNENATVLPWDGILRDCQAYYNLNAKTIAQVALSDGIATSRGDADKWIITLCNGKAQIRQRIRLTLAEDGYRVVKFKFEGTIITNDQEMIEKSNAAVARKLAMQAQMLNSENETYFGNDPEILGVQIVNVISPLLTSGAD